MINKVRICHIQPGDIIKCRGYQSTSSSLTRRFFITQASMDDEGHDWNDHSTLRSERLVTIVAVKQFGIDYRLYTVEYGSAVVEGWQRFEVINR